MSALNDKAMKDGELLISMTIFPAEKTALSFRVNLYTDGLLATTVGPASPQEWWNEDAEAVIKIIEAENFSPVLTMYNQLSESKKREFEERIHRIDLPEQDDARVVFGSVWYITITYRGQTWQDVFFGDGNYTVFDENMSDIIEKLIENSPIPIIAYDYFWDINEIEYFNSLRFIPWPPIKPYWLNGVETNSGIDIELIYGNGGYKIVFPD